MSIADRRHDDAITDFSRRLVEVDGVVKTVYVAGSGPAVVLMPEMPGISPDVLRLARWVRDAGFTVYVPSLFGVDGAYPTVEGGTEVVRRACVSAEFRAFAGGGTSPVAAWLRGLARQAHAECGGPGVGAIGLCFTGNFALTMTLEPAVIAPVVNHPSLPLDDPAGLEIERRGRARRPRPHRARRTEGSGVPIRQATGGAPVSVSPPTKRSSVTPSTAESFRAAYANADSPPFFRDVVASPHSVVTAHLVDEHGHPTLKARDEILAFLTERLRAPIADVSPPSDDRRAAHSHGWLLRCRF